MQLCTDLFLIFALKHSELLSMVQGSLTTSSRVSDTDGMTEMLVKTLCSSRCRITSWFPFDQAPIGEPSALQYDLSGLRPSVRFGRLTSKTSATKQPDE